ncbi:hypothetical protein [Hamadaea tsunoensis]|uniref:hypothetical protein n=1 Tax=Hamadaea tsunoensis TaxID=53368 RepID=UPI00040F1647|nr:hypothetical protein [Hamadaea tsunoensis]
MFLRRSVVRLGASAAVLAALALPAAVPGPAAAAAPSYTLEERATALTTPSLIYIEARYAGFVRLRSTGALVYPKQIVMRFSCTGVVVDTAGYAVTPTYCLDPGIEVLRQRAFAVVAGNLVAEKKLAPDKAAGYARDLVKNAVYTTEDKTRNAELSVYVQRFSATASATTPITATIADRLPIRDGNAALLKLSVSGLPAAVLSATPPAAGASMYASGFTTADRSANGKPADGASFSVRSRQTAIVGEVGGQGRLDGDLGPESAGGVLTDSEGHVVGLLNANFPTDTRPVMVTTVATIQQLMTDQKIDNTGASTDDAYRQGIDAYFGGRYSDAIAQLDKVLAEQPDNRTAADYRRQAADRMNIEGSQPGSSAMPVWLVGLLAAIGGALLIGIIVMVVLMLVRRSHRDRAADEILVPISINPFSPTSGIPQSVPPISGGGYPEYPTAPYPLTQPQPATPGAMIPQPPVQRPPMVPPPVAAQPEQAAAQQLPVPPLYPAPQETAAAPVAQPVAPPVAQPESELPPLPAQQPPAVQQPFVQQPVVQQPFVQQPVVQQPFAQPAAQQPAVQQPVAQPPVPQQPVAQQPVAAPPVAQQPEAYQPIFQQPIFQPAAPPQEAVTPAPLVAPLPPVASEPSLHTFPVPPVVEQPPAPLPVPADFADFAWPEDADEPPADADETNTGNPWAPPPSGASR